ncbi:MAG: enoyl-CoA hydratase/isomerase family protein [Rickettsiales bacterium]|nr:enoyl-CoA hydratase/isomerase family protein [Rickettsiales bacterium]
MSALTLDIDARGVAFVGLNRPEVHNAFDAALIAEITAAFEALDANPKVRLAVLFGHGKSFCAGGDLNWMKAMKGFSPEENMADAKKLAGMYITLSRFSKPLIGVVQGLALGGGSGLCAVCDYVVASDACRFGFTEARIGLAPATISPFVMEKIGVSAARAYFLSGAQFDAGTALRMGLVHQLVAADGLVAARDAVVAEFLKAAPGAAAASKAMIANVSALVSESGDVAAVRVTDYTAQLIAERRASEEGQAGMAALLGKTKAPWVSE